MSVATRTVTHMTRTSPTFYCTECGWNAVKWVGRCSECHTWGTVIDGGSARSIRAIRPSEDRAAVRIGDITTRNTSHRPCGIGELDRVLGGGIVAGAAVLLSGDPGVGKSTLLLEVAARAAATGLRVLYVTAEESLTQVRLRADRTHAIHAELFVAAETDLAAVLGHINDIQPGLLIVDSVQTVASSLTDGLPGHPSQVREVATSLIRTAKERNLPILLVGHVIKDGSIAGPRVLEHLVDVVCQFEGDRQTSLRFIRTLKNRFGPTDEVGCFEMTGDGIAEIPDPSSLFRSTVPGAVSGTCVTVALEGKRAFPVEVQALVVATKAPQPRRIMNGVDPSRVAMIIAVLERRAGLRSLSEHDVYVSTVGGIRLSEPGADLAIALAITSAMCDTAIPNELAAFGEISLTGDVRPVTAAKQRATEAHRLGYTTTLDTAVGNVRAAIGQALTATKKEKAA